ncbi:Imm30 family immunity protein [Pseudomonas hunanensis]|uniref:Imm30 family immunity protein n=1 Tax=Pseudomonas hunanensis TaxID=1247546 RepID=UPI0038027593
MSLKNQLHKYSQLESNTAIDEFTDTLKKMALTGDRQYIPETLSYLDDESEHVDVMKDIVGMAESFNVEDYIKAVLDSTISLAEKSPDWLDYIIYRITNSEQYTAAYKNILQLHSKKKEISNQLRMFLIRNPEKIKSIEYILQ